MEHMEQTFDQAAADSVTFLELLDAEQQALVNRDMVALEKLLADKAPLVNALAQHDQAILSFCQQLSIEPGAGLQDYISAHGSASLQASYAAFKQALQKCQQANERNARLIRHNQQATSQLLDLLRNQGESSQNIYDRQGLASRTGSQRNLTKV